MAYGWMQLVENKIHRYHDMYKESIHAYNLALKSAREYLFSNIINSNTNNSQTLFVTIDRLYPTQINQ